jgi:tetratricopeptide (TPR) repeat protein
VGIVFRFLGRLTEAREHQERALALYREIGARHSEGYALAALAEDSDAEGDAGAALRLAEESLALRREIGHGDGVAASLLKVGDLRRRRRETDAARSAFEESLRLSREQGRAAEVAQALVRLACLPGGDVKAAEEALTAAGAEADSAGLRFLLWQATGERAHLVAARRLLDESLARVPAEHHAAMLANVRVNREIVAACKAEGIA